MVLVDFGLARRSEHSQQTATGTIMGTLAYMAPEVARGQRGDERSDVYGLGVVLYQMAAGDFTRALAPGWERDIADPLLREDIAACVDGDPLKRLDYATGTAGRQAKHHAEIAPA